MRRSRPKAAQPVRKLRRRAEAITARRVTLLPGFLSGGVQSQTVRRAGAPSKSIFREIRERYAQVEGANGDFGERIFAATKPAFTARECALYKRAIFEEVALVDEVLAGKLDPGEMALNRKRQYEEEKENYPIKFPHVPQSKWIYQTPPNRKLHYGHSRMEDNCIKPAIVETCNNNKVVYEINNKINVDFSNYSHRQEIDIDKRYMVEVTSVPRDDVTFQCEDQEEHKKFQLIQSDPYELENHFLSLTCRPKKAPMTVSRFQNLKRKRDIFEPEASCSTINEFDSSFSFINNLGNLEESFTFKFTAAEGATTGHLFDFDGNKKDSFDFHY